MAEAPVVFYSYSHRDEDLKDRLDAHLSALRREGRIQTWHDRKVLPGADWTTEINDAVLRADIVLILVSADFIASEYCWGVEFKKALERHDRRAATVVPIIVRSCDWRNTELGRLQALPRDGRAVTTWPNDDEAWTDVARGLRSVVDATHVGVPRPVPLPPALAPVEFAHINVRPDRKPRWREFEDTDCPFGGGCDRYFSFEELVYGSDLFLDVMLHNTSAGDVVLSGVGVEVEELVDILYVYGFPEPVKFEPPKDEYEVAMPDLNDLVEEDNIVGPPPTPVRVNRHVMTRLPDPIGLPAGAAYRYFLRLTNYQRNVPNHARLRLTADAGGGLAKSPLLHVFTK
jgi:hypothetical protein